jgi:hypothetical protein
MFILHVKTKSDSANCTGKNPTMKSKNKIYTIKKMGHTWPPFGKFKWFKGPFPDPHWTMKYSHTYTCSKNIAYVGLQL